MKTLFSAVVLTVFMSAGLSAEDLVPPAEVLLPTIENNWVRRKDSGSHGSYSWVIFDNMQSGDVLSFVEWKVREGTKASSSAVGQASIETFMDDGSARPGSPRKGRRIGDCVRHRIISIKIEGVVFNHDIEALEYTYVYERETLDPGSKTALPSVQAGPKDNATTLAHGYCAVVNNKVLFVQHTSSRAISSEFAFDMLSGIVAKHLQISDKPHSISKGKILKVNN